MTAHVAIATGARIPQLTGDDAILRDALDRRVRTSVVVRDDPAVD